MAEKASITISNSMLMDPLLDAGGMTTDSEGLKPLVLMSVLLATLGPLTFGFSLGYTSPVSQQLTGVDCSNGCSLILSASELASVGAVVNIGGMIGSSLGGLVADRVGGTRTMVLACVPFMIGFLGTASAVSYWMLVVGRVLCGVGGGMVSVMTPVYIAEIAPTRLRGMLGSMHQLAAVIGILLSYVLGLRAFELGWSSLALVGVAPTMILLLSALLVLPETPRWLCAVSRQDDAQRVLRRLRGTSNVSAELTRVQQAVSAHAGEPKATLADLLAPEMRMQMCIGCGMHALQQFSGVNAVIFFSSDILKQAGIENSDVGALAVGVVQVAATLVCCQLVDRAGRRTLIFGSSAGMAVSALLLSLYFHFKEDISSELASVLSVGSLLMYMIMFSLGFGAVPWILMPEIFPAHARGLASSIATLTSWSCSFIVTSTFQSLMDAITPAGAFLCCAVELMLAFLFVWKFVPETKGLALEEIQAHFKKRSKSRKSSSIPRSRPQSEAL